MKNLNKKKLFIFDMDGTIYLEHVLFNDALNLFNVIKQNNAKYVFITNNSSKSRKQYFEKLKGMGVDIQMDMIYSSTLITIKYLKENYINGLFFVVGTKAMVEEMKEANLNIVTSYNENVDAVILGYDTEINYQKLIDATKLINLNKDYIATHPDLVCPTLDGYIPDCGALIELLFAATNKRPHIMGKPNPNNIDFILDYSNLTKEDVVMIGDRLYTDIKMGIDAKVDTILVLSGETKKVDLKSIDIKPILVIENISILYQMLKTKKLNFKFEISN